MGQSVGQGKIVDCVGEKVSAFLKCAIEWLSLILFLNLFSSGEQSANDSKGFGDFQEPPNKKKKMKNKSKFKH